MNLEDFKPQMRVAYIPAHAHGDIGHPDVERGTVSSIGTKFVFVKFDKQLVKFGWEGTTSQSCDHKDLIDLERLAACVSEGKSLDKRQTQASLGGPDMRSPQQILDDWKTLIQQERLSEKSCLKHGLADLSKWHEGKADAIERCADQLEFLIIPKIKAL